MGLEVEAAGLAAVNCRGEDLETMQKAHEDMKDAVGEHQLDRLVEADLRFHGIICVALDQSTLRRVVRLPRAAPQIRDHPDAPASSEKPPHRANAQREHEMIFFAINTRNAEAARAAARLHVLNTLSGSRPTPTDICRSEVAKRRGE